MFNVRKVRRGQGLLKTFVCVENITREKGSEWGKRNRTNEARGTILASQRKATKFRALKAWTA